MSVAPPRLSQAIHYFQNASQCHWHYCKASSDGHSGGRKMAVNSWLSWEKTRERLWWMDVFDPYGWKAEMVSCTWDRESVDLVSPLPSAAQPCQDEKQLVKLPLSVPLSLVSKQALYIFNRQHWTSRDGNTRTESSTEVMTGLMSAWGQMLPEPTPPYGSHQINIMAVSDRVILCPIWSRTHNKKTKCRPLGCFLEH